MRKVIPFLLFAVSASSQVYVNGFVNSNGTYVAPHYRSSPNGTNLDNYSTLGNLNPFTGELGSKMPIYTSPTTLPPVVIPQSYSIPTPIIPPDVIVPNGTNYNRKTTSPGLRYSKKFKEDNTVLALIKFQGFHNVSAVKEFKYKSGKWELVNTDVSKTMIEYRNYEILFKRSYGQWLNRELVFKGVDSKTGTYLYNSQYGQTYISKDFKVVWLFDNPDSNGKPTNKYVFYIAN